MNDVKNVVDEMARANPNGGDYTGEDGLLYCGLCRSPKEAYFDASYAALFGRDRHPINCTCQQKRIEEMRIAELQRKHENTVKELKKDCFDTPKQQEWCFENDNGANPQMEYAHLYADHFDEFLHKNIGYLFWGDVGTGKSFSAACIANALMAKEIPVRMTNFAAVLNDLSDSFEGRNAYIARLCSYPLLILDDFGMERNTEYALEQVYNVIDSRYRSGMPLIVTTNLSTDELKYPQDMPHARIYDRLLEMCTPVLFNGPNIRQQTAQNNLDMLKGMIKEDNSL